MGPFPLYRKYADRNTWFRILGEDAFEEMKILGDKYNIHLFKAETFIDRHLIEDMIKKQGGHWEDCAPEEYFEKEKYCREHLQFTPSL